MEKHLPRREAFLLLGAVAFAWGTTWPVTKAIIEHLPPLWTTSIRSAIATVMLFGISAGRRHVVLPRCGDVPVVLNVALLHMVLFSGLVAVGLQFVPAGRSVVLAYTTPIWVALGSRIFLAERLDRVHVAGIVLGMSGLLLLFSPWGVDWHDSKALLGNALVLLAAFCWAASILHVRAHRWISTPFELVPWQALIATVVLTVFAFVFEGLPRPAWNTELVVLLIYGGGIGIALPYWATVTVNRSLPAITTSFGLLGVPVVGVLCSAVALGETLTITLVLAMGLIIGGIAVGNGIRDAERPRV